jgi:biopolymer transport protein TolR
MGMNGAGAATSSSKRRHRRRAVMSEINVTPMVDVMLVLLIIFMVSAPLLTVGVPIDLPRTQAKSLDQDREPLTVSVNGKGEVYLQNAEIKVDDLVAKLQAITQARGGLDERICARGPHRGLWHGDAGHGTAIGGRVSSRGPGDGGRKGVTARSA